MPAATEEAIQPENPGTPTSVYEVVGLMLDQTAALAWQKLGLQPDYGTRKIEADLGQAKVAIDLCAHLASVLDPEIDDEDRRQLQNLVRDLRLNFVQRASGGAS